MKRWVLSLVLIISLNISAQAAVVNGTFYEWSDFEVPLKNVLVELEENSTIISYKVSTDGTYSFDLSPGNYSIKARYYRNNILELVGERDVHIAMEDKLREFDILLFPPMDSENEYLGDINLTSDMDFKNENDSSTSPLIILLILPLFALVIYFYWIKRKITPGETVQGEPLSVMPENTAQTTKRELPEDLRGLYDIILKAGGRTTQKDLRKKMACSEAKVSLMLDDLENRGFIKKIKKGRSNIIIAEVQQT